MLIFNTLSVHLYTNISYRTRTNCFLQGNIFLKYFKQTFLGCFKESASRTKIFRKASWFSVFQETAITSSEQMKQLVQPACFKENS